MKFKKSFCKIRKERDLSFMVRRVRKTGLSVDLLTVVKELRYDFFESLFPHDESSRWKLHKIVYKEL